MDAALNILRPDFRRKVSFEISFCRGDEHLRIYSVHMNGTPAEIKAARLTPTRVLTNGYFA